MKTVMMRPSEETKPVQSAKIIPLRGLKTKSSLKAAQLESSLDERFHGKSVRAHVREFGALFGAIMCGIAAARLYKGRPIDVPILLVTGGILLYIIGVKAPQLLRPLWRAWMGLAQLLGIISTFILLTVSWAVIVLPMALAMKMLRKKVMTMGFKEPVSSYWEIKSEAAQDFKNLEKQF